MSHHRRSLSRRGFMSGLAATFAVPMIIPRHVLGDDQNKPANEKLTVGCIGMGKMLFGSHLPHFLRMPEVHVAAVCDVDQSRRESGKQRVDQAYNNSDCAAYVDYRELLARDDIDAVVCATPDHWHAMVILDACAAGKDMYCEKPLTNNLTEAKAVMDAVNASEIVFQTGSQQRASENFRYACELVQNGHIGKIKRVTVGVGGASSTLRSARRGNGSRARLGSLAGTRAATRLQLSPQPSWRPRPFSGLAKLLRIRWRGHDRLGSTSFRYRSMGLGNGPIWADRNRAARETAGRPRRELRLREWCRCRARRSRRRDLFRDGWSNSCRSRKTLQQTGRRDQDAHC
jgi:hypothetical protein